MNAACATATVPAAPKDPRPIRLLPVHEHSGATTGRARSRCSAGEPRPPDGPQLDLLAVNRQLSGRSAGEVVGWAAETFGSGLVLSTSFGIQSAVMLHLVTRVVPDIPVVWVDTGYLPPETYLFADQLSERLALNLNVVQSPLSPARMEARYGKLWQAPDLDSLQRYDRIRKVEPMQRALRELGATAWLSGVRANQTDHRKTLELVGRQNGRYKVSPILGWHACDVHAYLRAHDLPVHPLFARGYATVGDWHSSRPVGAEDTHERDTRFGGRKQECGLHVELTEEEAASLDSSGL